MITAPAVPVDARIPADARVACLITLAALLNQASADMPAGSGAPIQVRQAVARADSAIQDAADAVLRAADIAARFSETLFPLATSRPTLSDRAAAQRGCLTAAV